MNTKIYEDMKKLKRKLGNNFLSASCFGSIIHKPISKIDDIDIMIRTNDKITAKDFLEIIKDLSLNFKINRIQDCTYDTFSNKSNSNLLTYDLVLVQEKESNSYFYQRNKDNFFRII